MVCTCMGPSHHDISDGHATSVADMQLRWRTCDTRDGCGRNGGQMCEGQVGGVRRIRWINLAAAGPSDPNLTIERCGQECPGARYPGTATNPGRRQRWCGIQARPPPGECGDDGDVGGLSGGRSADHRCADRSRIARRLLVDCCCRRVGVAFASRVRAGRRPLSGGQARRG